MLPSPDKSCWPPLVALHLRKPIGCAPPSSWHVPTVPRRGTIGPGTSRMNAAAVSAPSSSTPATVSPRDGAGVTAASSSAAIAPAPPSGGVRPTSDGQVPAADPEVPRPEYPRPDFEREQWVNLNGRWRFTFDPRNIGE